MDVVVLRPGRMEQARILADRLKVPLRRGWARVLRWSGRQLLARNVDPGTAGSLALICREVGFEPRLVETKEPSRLFAAIARAARPIAWAFFAVVAISFFVSHYIVGMYDPVAHALGFVWMFFITRDPRAFAALKLISAVVASCALGAVAAMIFYTVLAHLRLTTPLLAAAHRAVAPVSEAVPLPPAERARWRRLPIIALGALALIAVVIAALRLHARYPAQAAPRSQTLPRVLRATLPIPVDLREARAAVREATRPELDRRIVAAVAELAHILTGESAGEANAQFDGVWIVEYAGGEVGRLPAFPDFTDGLALLRGWATRLGARPTSKPPALPPLLDEAALDVLRDVQRRWSAGDRSGLHRGAAAACALAFQMLDEAELGDPVLARVLALLALDEAEGGPAPREEALLASAMGYWTAARAAAAQLPADDVVAAYLAEDLGTVEKGADGFARFVTRLLQEKRQIGQAAEILSGTSLALLKIPLHWRIDLYGQNNMAALPLVRASLAAEIDRERHDPAGPTSASRARATGAVADLARKLWGPSSLLARFDDLARAAGQTGAGPFYDHELVETYFRAALFSGVIEVEEALRHNKGYDGARALDDPLASPLSSSSGDLLRWHRFFLSRNALEDAPNPLDLLVSLRGLGVSQLSDVYRYTTGTLENGRTDQLRAARLLEARLDTRPDHLDHAQWYFRSASLDLPGTARACEALVNRDRARSAACAAFLGDAASLRALVNDRSTPIADRLRALGAAGEKHLFTAEQSEAAFQALLGEDDPWALVPSAYAQYLEKAGAYAHAREVLLDALHKPLGRVIVENLMVSAARMLDRQGLHEQAVAELRPLVPHHAGAQMRTALALSALGATEEPRTLARARLDRFKDWETLQTWVEVLWRTGADAEAARAVQHPPLTIEDGDFAPLFGPAFAHAFAGKDDRAAAAFAELAKSLALRKLRKIAEEVDVSGAHQQAFRLLEGLAPQDSMALVSAFRALREARGAEAARKWVETRLPKDDPRIAIAAYDQGATELLWLAPDTASEVWLLRAAAERIEPAGHTAEVAAHYQNDLDPRGRMLAGLDGEEKVLASAKTPADTCRAAWSLGVRAQSEGRLADASDWYRVSVESGRTEDREFRWSLRQLRQWQRSDAPLRNSSVDAHAGQVH